MRNTLALATLQTPSNITEPQKKDTARTRPAKTDSKKDIMSVEKK